MNERYNPENEPVSLTPLEIRILANRALLDGEILDVDFADEQPAGQPQPHRYVLELDPLPLQIYKESLPDAGNEMITSVMVEYNESYVTDDVDEPSMEPLVSVSIVSAIVDERDVIAETSQPIMKGVDYELPLDPIRDGWVMESYFYPSGQRAGAVSGDTKENVRQFAEDIRPLNDNDLELLRVII